jgi:hypothetical protein
MMTIPFDIFQEYRDGEVFWLESAATHQQARGRVQELAVLTPGQYLVLNQATGTELVISAPPWEN